MRVLITGGAGFIGSNLADQLLSQKHEVLVIDNYATSRRDNLTPQANLTIVEGSIADTALVNKLFADFHPEVLVHAAASYKDPENWVEDSISNVLGTANVTKAARENKVRRIVYFQTSLCYGKPQEQPITLKHRINPESSYAISKTAGEQYIALSGVDFISFRLANVFGPRNLSGPLPTFFKRLKEGKKCFVADSRRDFVYVKDLVNIVIKAIEGKGSRGYYHVSSGKDVSIYDLYQSVVSAMKLTGLDPVEVKPRSPDDVESILLDPSKTNQDFGWKVESDWKLGVADAIQWYEKHGVEQTFTHLVGAGEGKK